MQDAITSVSLRSKHSRSFNSILLCKLLHESTLQLRRGINWNYWTERTAQLV